MSKQEQIEAKVLGKQISHPKQYAPGILVAVPRYLNREAYCIIEDNLPFTGYDAWHSYELSFLTQKGLPVTGILKMVYPCESAFLVESKSLKLYLNSFNMGKHGVGVEDGINKVLDIIRTDLNSLLKTEVQLTFHKQYSDRFDFGEYDLLEGQEELEDCEFSVYNEQASFLSGVKRQDSRTYKVSSNLLRSNCKITHQPDWGSVFIHIKSTYDINLTGLLQYIVSIRDENHFHEEICEMVYKRLMVQFDPDEIMVACLYTRRGGIDICPVRVNKMELLPKYITTSNILTKPAFRQ